MIDLTIYQPKQQIWLILTNYVVKQLMSNAKNFDEIKQHIENKYKISHQAMQQIENKFNS